ncbi:MULTISPECIES: cyanoexosortase A system-associated protein [unclassified Tolypothrix]|uniref:cyanoexosortase A system-associated protein n=1 Tax=unclassified Tolypothrix TaxID=2649714 RepID=UPI0005EAB217|nr:MULTISPECIES: cyanoexosortase A system-associated protein [unclassified Tolypothrix]BAY90417.1 hypothetical protein NIES3275_24330 [Microchaete diplosiphon NIES-3275]EKF01050.1 hypothetical protein FDUTEX481_08361 [Tolypothrix sp. PCC 7601]MBE9086434.1 cyanoexosortase A system-associated protein [Tolypothrix sp. LEGE 11397]UYD24589.1 cyanoexosortase A system-associated protein [Tolypothrix sp. PCC 7712]UYD33181.1 cyanoexosortase A system-associated protein [Tolypothrix sp. PCC 7601]
MTGLTKSKPKIKSQIEPRLGLLVVTSLSVFLTIAKLIFAPNTTIQKIQPFLFPETVVLDKNTIWKSQALTDIVVQQPKQYDAVISGRRYRYYYDHIPIDIEMRYVVGALGNVEGMIYKNTEIKLPIGKLFQTVRQQPGIGYYGLFTHNNKAYLSSCINPQGESTVTPDEFMQNRYLYNLSFQHIFSWLLGKESFFDKRCLWAHLSTPINGFNSHSAYQRLEKAWFNSYSWWSYHFPKP